MLWFGRSVVEFAREAIPKVKAALRTQFEHFAHNRTICSKRIEQRLSCAGARCRCLNTMASRTANPRSESHKGFFSVTTAPTYPSAGSNERRSQRLLSLLCEQLGFSGCERNFKTVKRKVKPAAAGLDICLFARPAKKKASLRMLTEKLWSSATSFPMKKGFATSSIFVSEGMASTSTPTSRPRANPYRQT